MVVQIVTSFTILIIAIVFLSIVAVLLIAWKIYRYFKSRKTVKKKKEIKEVKAEVKESNFVDRIIGWNKRRQQKSIYKKSISATLIRMELNNGQHDEVIVKAAPDLKGFDYAGGFYFFHNESKYYVRSSKMWAYDYHQSFCLPMVRHIPVDEVVAGTNAMLKAKGNIKIVDMATDPLLLNHFIKSEVIRQMLQGMKMSVLIKIAIIILSLVGLFVIGDLMIDVYDSGILESLTG